MSPINDGGPAFPVPTSFIPNPPDSAERFTDSAAFGCGPTPGMTLRDWFAGQALVSFQIVPQQRTPTDATIAMWAYFLADAMLIERAKERK